MWEKFIERFVPEASSFFEVFFTSSWKNYFLKRVYPAVKVSIFSGKGFPSPHTVNCIGVSCFFYFKGEMYLVSRQTE